MGILAFPGMGISFILRNLGYFEDDQFPIVWSLIFAIVLVSGHHTMFRKNRYIRYFRYFDNLSKKDKHICDLCSAIILVICMFVCYSGLTFNAQRG